LEHERDQKLALAAHDQHVVRTRREQMVHPAERLAARRTHLEPLEIRPVVLVGSEARQRGALDRDLRADQLERAIPVVTTRELRDETLAVRAAVLDLDLTDAAVLLERPAIEAEDVLPRLGVGMNLDPALDAEHAAHAAERHALVLPAHRERTASGGFGAAAIFLQQARHALRDLSALRHPIARAVEVDAQPLLAAGGDRIEETETLDVAAVTASTAVRHHDVIERPFRRAAAGQTNPNHGFAIP